MKISELDPNDHPYTQLGQFVLAVISRRREGEWCVYVGAVKGYDHSQEWQRVLDLGNKQKPAIAEAIVKNLFYPGFEIDLPYSL